MSAEVYDCAKRYWQIITRVNRNPETKGLRLVAGGELSDLLPSLRNEAVKRRIRSFVSSTSSTPPRPPLRTA